MSTQTVDAIEQEIRELNYAILGSEGWAAGYANQPEAFKQLLVVETDMEKLFRDYLRQLSQRINSYVNWSKYHMDVVAVKANETRTLEGADVSTLFDEDGFDEDEQTQLETLISEIYINGVAIGYAAGRAEVTGTFTPINKTVESPITTAIQEAADQHVKELSEFLDSTTAKKVVQSIQESIALGESQQLAMQRLSDFIDDPDRAEMIARTESVRAWSIGQNQFGIRNGATQKSWEALPGADSGSGQTPCLDNDGTTVDILDSFPSGDEMTPAHPNCRCKVNYIYPDGNEIEDV
jgi:hypothetical protein